MSVQLMSQTVPETKPAPAAVSAPMPEQPRQPISFAADGRGLELKTFEDMWRFANLLYKSGLAPKGLDTAEKIMVCLEAGAEVGFKAMQAMQSFAPINGRPMMYGDAPLALAFQSGLIEDFCEQFDGDPSGDSFAAVCTVKRRGLSSPVTRRFSVAMAKRAKLWGKEGPWTFYPQRMLQFRARSWALRDALADVLRGIPIREEYIGVDEVLDGLDLEPKPLSEQPTGQRIGFGPRTKPNPSAQAQPPQPKPEPAPPPEAFESDEPVAPPEDIGELPDSGQPEQAPDEPAPDDDAPPAWFELSPLWMKLPADKRALAKSAVPGLRMVNEAAYNGLPVEQRRDLGDAIMDQAGVEKF